MAMSASRRLWIVTYQPLSFGPTTILGEGRKVPIDGGQLAPPHCNQVCPIGPDVKGRDLPRSQRLAVGPLNPTAELPQVAEVVLDCQDTLALA